MALLLKNAAMVLKDEILENGDLKIREGIIEKIGSSLRLEDYSFFKGEVLDLEEKYLVPGFIDLHTHGAKGKDVMDGEIGALDTIAHYKITNGTTGFLATTLTAERDKLFEVCKKIKKYINAEDKLNNLLGIHLEGPAISREKRGAQNPEYIRQLKVEELKNLLEASGNKIKIITLAPEKEGAKEVISYARRNNIIAAAGHTDASYEEMQQGFKWGIDHAAHFFNGMKGLHHRNPGVVGAFLEAEEPTLELIVDGEHIHQAVINLVVNNKELEKITLITDSMRAAGMEDGEYDLGGLKVIIKGGVARLESGNLAGSTLTMNQVLKNAVKMTSLDLVEAVKLVSTNPAQRLGVEDMKGSIAEGKAADLVVLDRQFDPQMTILEGEVVYNNL